MKSAFASAALALLAQQVTGESRIVFHTLNALVNARMDPIVDPGVVGMHAHRVVGGSNFNFTYDPDVQRQSKCTQMQASADKSVYWHNMIYKKLNNGTYAGMPAQTRVYYNFPTLADGAKLEPFPYDFQMIAGNPKRRNFTEESNADLATFFWCQTSDPMDFSNVQGVDYDGLPTQQCTVLSSKVVFPSCWNGQAYNASSPYAHLKYPKWGAGLFGADCPTGYERRLPVLLLETFHFDAWVQNSNVNDGHYYALSTGDLTGYGHHADFANGWDQATLTRMVNNCQHPSVAEPANVGCPDLESDEFPFSQEASYACKYEGLAPVENVGFDAPLESLPGCNIVGNSGTSKCSRIMGGKKLTAISNTKIAKVSSKAAFP